MSSVQHAFADTITEFLEAAVHTALLSRQVYAAELFERQRLFGIFVQKARHPELCQYIGGVLSNLKPLLLRDTLQELDLLIVDAHNQPVEKLAFVLRGVAAPADGHEVAALEAAFASALLKLQFVDNLLRPLPPGCTFQLVALTTSREGVNSLAFAEEEPTVAALPQPVTALPVRSIHLEGCLSLQVLFEETERRA